MRILTLSMMITLSGCGSIWNSKYSGIIGDGYINTPMGEINEMIDHNEVDMNSYRHLRKKTNFNDDLSKKSKKQKTFLKRTNDLEEDTTQEIYYPPTSLNNGACGRTIAVGE